MNIKAGLVGLPNVGKSTLFNALTRSSVPAQNYPFCTIDPHLAITQVPDPRVAQLQKMYNSQKPIYPTISFVDIAGLVKGAASGQGLGNQFLSHIREVDLILHVVRCFEDPNIIYEGAQLDPLGDFETILAELMLKDLESVQKRKEKVQHQLKGAGNNPKVAQELQAELSLLNDLQQALDQANAATVTQLITTTPVQTIPLLSSKKFLIIANIAEQELENQQYLNNPHYQKLVERFGSDYVIPISAKIEYELSQLPPEEASDFMEMMGIKTSGLDKIIQEAYKHLGLITFFTCGPKEIHAWPIRQGISIRKAAGEIHSDLERGFICADVFNYKDLLAYGSQTQVKEKGAMRIEGQDYIVHDGDIVHIKFNV